MKPRIHGTLQKSTPLLLATLVVFAAPASMRGAEIRPGENTYAGERDSYSFRLDASAIPLSTQTDHFTANAGFGGLPIASQPLP